MSELQGWGGACGGGVSALTELCVAVWTGEDRTEAEEVVDEEEEEESGSLDEEEIKKMQSDEVCGDRPSAASMVMLSGGHGLQPGRHHSESRPHLISRAQQAWR